MGLEATRQVIDLYNIYRKHILFLLGIERLLIDLSVIIFFIVKHFFF